MLKMALPWLLPRNAGIALASTAFILPVTYFIYFAHSVRSSTTSFNGVRKPRSNKAPALPPMPASLPDDVKSDNSDWVLAYERVVSHPMPASDFGAFPMEKKDSSLSPMLKIYTRAAHVAFGSTPQAFLIRAVVDPATKRTFDPDWIQKISFEKGDVVNGAYKVSYHGIGPTPDSERIELVIEAPPSYKGHVPRGIILAGIERVGEDIVFINETWMWRRETEKPTLVESTFGAWFHAVMAGWLIMRGVSGLKPS
ncbi:hypothetical protein HJFPF1_02506 [Paramyrothecium foliicola]|nr:hypothetical protein HJFPF1_02506 [Paramyrothecium foliicola]